MNRLLLSFLVMMAALTSINAQTTTNTPSSPVAVNQLVAKGIQAENNWSFYSDKESELCYIDFESINVNLNEIVVKDQKGAIVFKEAVDGLPVDSIYELDCSQFPIGVYTIELHSYTGIFKRTFSK